MLILALDEFTATGNDVQGNLIGLDADVTDALANGPGDAAAIAIIFNEGILELFGFDPGVTAEDIEAMRGGSIHDNVGLGIDLVAGSEDSFGVTPNDLQDPDIGPNNLQNYPVLTAATTAETTTVTGTLNSLADTSFRLEFFSSPAADPSNFGEGETLLGATNVTTNSSGDATFSFDLEVAVADGRLLTATATRALDDQAVADHVFRTVGNWQAIG